MKMSYYMIPLCGHIERDNRYCPREIHRFSLCMQMRAESKTNESKINLQHKTAAEQKEEEQSQQVHGMENSSGSIVGALMQKNS